MTTRRSLAWLIGLVPFAAKGQKLDGSSFSTKCIGSNGPGPCPQEPTRPIAPLGWMMGNAKVMRDQCPVCGTLAPPYRCQPPCGTYFDNQGTLRALSISITCSPDQGRTINLTRCLRCNNAFFQDAVN